MFLPKVNIKQNDFRILELSSAFYIDKLRLIFLLASHGYIDKINTFAKIVTRRFGIGRCVFFLYKNSQRPLKILGQQWYLMHIILV